MPVVKYDRKGYKPRPRQLLLTPNAVVIVEDAKVKQRIDYANLTGQPEWRPARVGKPCSDRRSLTSDLCSPLQESLSVA